MGQILETGGQILIAVEDETPIGCCALIAMELGVYEVAKMAVRETHRNHGVGRRILTYCASPLEATSPFDLVVRSGSVRAAS